MKFTSFVLSSLLSVTFVVSQGSKVGSVKVGYYSDWTSAGYPPEKVDYTKLTHINYAFIEYEEGSYTPKLKDPANLKQVVSLAHKSGVKVLASLGGWEGSKTFSTMVQDAGSRTKFIEQFINFVKQYDLDGLDFDWEFPGKAGAGNKFDVTNDSNNYLLLLKQLRPLLANKLLTAAVAVTPFEGPNGPIKDTKPFAQLFDFLNVMTYDFNGGWSKVSGPVGGLDFEAGKAEQISVKSALNAWEQSGFPKSKLVVGVPFYGYGWKINPSGAVRSQYNPVASALPTVFFHEFLSKKILKSPLEANTEAGWVRNFDQKTQTPWLYNSNTNELYAYDDPKSLKIKSNFAKCSGYLGTMIWALSQDSNQILLNSLQGEVDAKICQDITAEQPSVPSTTSAGPPTLTYVPTPVSSNSAIITSQGNPTSNDYTWSPPTSGVNSYSEVTGPATPSTYVVPTASTSVSSLSVITDYFTNSKTHTGFVSEIPTTSTSSVIDYTTGITSNSDSHIGYVTKVPTTTTSCTKGLTTSTSSSHVEYVVSKPVTSTSVSSLSVITDYFTNSKTHTGLVSEVPTTYTSSVIDYATGITSNSDSHIGYVTKVPTTTTSCTKGLTTSTSSSQVGYVVSKPVTSTSTSQGGYVVAKPKTTSATIINGYPVHYIEA